MSVTTPGSETGRGGGLVRGQVLALGRRAREVGYGGRRHGGDTRGAREVLDDAVVFAEGGIAALARS